MKPKNAPRENVSTIATTVSPIDANSASLSLDSFDSAQGKSSSA